MLHLKWVLPGYAAAARNAGSAVLDHRQPSSRLEGMMRASALLRDHGQIMLAPNGSLVTPIEERVSPSAWMLAQHYDGCVVPWLFRYDDQLTNRPYKKFVINSRTKYNI